MKRHLLPAALLAALVIAFRLLGASFPESFPNFQPLPALLLCSLVFLQGRTRWILPLGLWLLTDPFVSLLQGYSLLGWHHLGLALGVGSVVLITLAFPPGPRTTPLLLSTAGAALTFYLLTNTLSFFTLPQYPKTWEGFLQAQWTGPVGYGPTWIFLRNLLAANLLFTSLILLAHRTPLLAAKDPVSKDLARC